MAFLLTKAWGFTKLSLYVHTFERLAKLGVQGVQLHILPVVETKPVPF